MPKTIWTPRRVNRLQKLIQDMTKLDFEEIFKVFPGHSKSSIRYAIEKFRLTTRYQWSVEEEQILREKWREGWTAKELSRILPRRTPPAISKQARVLGIKNSRRKQWSKERANLLISYSKIYTVSEIARAMKTPYSEVYAKLRALGVPYKIDRQTTCLTAEQVREIKSALKEGRFFHREIASWYGVSRATISAISRRKTWAHLS